MAPRPVALFDMDRTLVRKETASLYIRFQRDEGNATWRDSVRVAWWVAQYTLGVIDVQRAAAEVIAAHRGLPETAMAARCDDWVRRYVARHIPDGARQAVREHKQRGALTAIVTGSSPYAARPVARLLGIDHVVASDFEVEGHLFTGRASQPLCYGEGKVVRAARLADAHGFRLADATFYTDSYTDLPLLLAVGQPVVVNPDPRLRREAARRGWPVLRWLAACRPAVSPVSTSGALPRTPVEGPGPAAPGPSTLPCPALGIPRCPTFLRRPRVLHDAPRAHHAPRPRLRRGARSLDARRSGGAPPEGTSPRPSVSRRSEMDIPVDSRAQGSASLVHAGLPSTFRPVLQERTITHVLSSIPGPALAGACWHIPSRGGADCLLLG